MYRTVSVFVSVFVSQKPSWRSWTAIYTVWNKPLEQNKHYQSLDKYLISQNFWNAFFFIMYSERTTKHLHVWLCLEDETGFSIYFCSSPLPPKNTA